MTNDKFKRMSFVSIEGPFNSVDNSKASKRNIEMK